MIHFFIILYKYEKNNKIVCYVRRQGFFDQGPSFLSLSFCVLCAPALCLDATLNHHASTPESNETLECPNLIAVPRP
jgi:hypothetical protein